MAGDFEKLAYEEAVRGLDKQEGLLEALRARTGILLASSFLAVSVFGQQAVRNPGPRGLAIAALVAFVISMAAGVFILLPKRNLVFAAAAADFYAGFYDLRSDMAEVYRRLAYDVDHLWDSNEREIRRLSWTSSSLPPLSSSRSSSGRSYGR
ncbi:MAG TPA: hypothetical protein VFX44_05735 [Solirubrobacterales bacterium]|nr:hypothetical protein [Solirubrobacterales bacterium]